MDWRALTQVDICRFKKNACSRTHAELFCCSFQVKELGVVIYNCSSLAKDLHKVFQSYWVMGEANSSLPARWPAGYDAAFNQHRPLLVREGNVSSKLYLAVSCFSVLLSINLRMVTQASRLSSPLGVIWRS